MRDLFAVITIVVMNSKFSGAKQAQAYRLIFQFSYSSISARNRHENALQFWNVYKLHFVRFLTFEGLVCWVFKQN